MVANNGGSGGGFGSNGGSPMVVGCLFYDNHTTTSGGAATVIGSAIFRSCRFISNSTNAGNTSGGALSLSGPVQVENCLFIHNTSGSGGAIAANGPTPVITNCTFVANVATGTPGGAFGGAIRVGGFPLPIRNCISYNNVPDQFHLIGGSINATYSNIEDWVGGVGNIDDGPFFSDPFGPDNIPGTPDDDYSIRSFSPCADSGDNTVVPVGVTTDVVGNPRFVDDPNSPDNGNGRAPLVDMGCYEVQPTIVPPDTCPADIAPPGGDDVVNIDDLLRVISDWGLCP